VAATEPEARRFSSRRGARRLLALALAACSLALGRPAGATNHATGTLFYYADSDKVQVLSPSLTGQVEVGPITASARTSVDVVSAASVDLVSSGSPRGFTEQRVQVDASCAYDLGAGRAASALFALSREPDFLTFTGGVGTTWDIVRRQATLSLSYAFSRSRVGRRDDTDFSERRDQHQLELGVSPLLSKSAVADLVYALTVVEGFQSSAYRRVRLYEPGVSAHATAVPERVPELRVRHALVLRVRKRFARPLFGLLEYRAYADTWGVLAHALRGRALVELGPFTFGAEARAYRQTGALFYRNRYETFPSAAELRTADKELTSMWTALGGLHAEWTGKVGRLEALRVGLGGDVLYMRYLDFERLPSRTAGMLSVDTTLEF
jgi:hypothetical protein